ncbi:undecaprenyl/decaprenyl-phosphate alpha-N-acetylglucosaminyl 1-phosphate transferase [bacterium]|nr:undecaprenyl/decaprenyl-phosphate alpha-N-acetylglucosaminyl 1-phosphate transferase [bacterium]
MIHVAAGLLAFGVPFVLSVALTAAARCVAPRIGFVDRPGGHKGHERPMPLGGGMAMFLAWLLPVGGLTLAAWLAPGVLGPRLAPLGDRVAPIGLLLLGGSIVMALGLWDDVRNLPPLFRLVVQVGLATGLYATSRELRITFFTDQWSLTSLAYTVVWVVGITNAFNFLDNTDGLSAGVAGVAALILAVVGVQTGQMVMAGLALALAGAAGGFLIFNFPPASIYMGDAGGLFLGFTLSMLTVLFTYYKSGPAPSGRLYGALMPIFILAVPIFDTATVMAIRLRERRPLWQGDHCHFSHRLLALGMNKRETVLFIYLCTFCLGLASTLLNKLDATGAIIIFVIGITIFTLIALLERAGRRRNGDRE